MSKPAKPDRFTVDVIGTPDPPTAEYYVLNVVHDFEARVLLRKLVRRYRGYGQMVKADELERLLNETNDAHRDAVKAREPKEKRSKGKKAFVDP